MIIDCIADLHGFYPKLEGGDLLIIAGDLTARDSCLEHGRFQMWLHEQNYRKKVVVAGNHDARLESLGFSSVYRQYKELDEDYLCDSGCEFEGLKIWGSPWSLTFDGINPRCASFTGSESDLTKKYALIPEDTDILITHTPPFGFMDEVENQQGDGYSHCGSVSLIDRVDNLDLKLLVFGHIHQGYGIQILVNIKESLPTFVNASHVNEYYEPVNKPIRVRI
jgi:Icc-related predicted phosphoesterase